MANPSGTSAGWRYEYAPTTATGTVNETGSQLHVGIDRDAGKECESVFKGSGSTFRTGIHETPAEETRTTEDILREKSGRVHGRVFIIKTQPGHGSPAQRLRLPIVVLYTNNGTH